MPLELRLAVVSEFHADAVVGGDFIEVGIVARLPLGYTVAFPVTLHVGTCRRCGISGEQEVVIAEYAGLLIVDYRIYHAIVGDGNSLSGSVTLAVLDIPRESGGRYVAESSYVSVRIVGTIFVLRVIGGLEGQAFYGRPPAGSLGSEHVSLKVNSISTLG